MKSESANVAVAIDSPFVEPYLFVKAEFTSPSSKDLFLCSRSFGICNVFEGACYDPLILSWGLIRCGEIDPVTYGLYSGDVGIEFMNDVPIGGYDGMSALLAAFDWAFATLTLSVIFDNANSSGDDTAIFKGRMENIESMSRESVTVRISDIAMAYNHKWPHTIVNTTDYPDADPDDIGKMLPQVWGSCKRVPLRAVDAGWLTTLAEDLDDSETSIDLTDAAGLSATGTIQIDVEQITYTGKTGNTLTGCTRGANATTAVEHDLGAKVAEIQADYFYILGHAVKAINAVYVDGVLQPAANYTAYTGQSGDQHGSYPGKACIDFSVLPAITKQINVAIADTIAVSDTIGVSDTIDVSDGIGVSDTIDFTAPAGSYYTSYSSSYSNNGVDNPANSVDGNANTYGGMNQANDDITYNFTDPSVGTAASQIFHAIMSGQLGTETIDVEKGGSHVTTWTMTTTPSEYIYNATTDTAWTRTFGFDNPILGGGEVRIHMIWKEVRYAPDLTKVGSASKTGSATKTGAASKTGAATKTGTVTLSGNSVADTVIGGVVSIDVDGYQDDGSGTYTGTPTALIERPDHVFKHWIIAMLGLTAADINSTVYATSGTAYASASFAFGVCLLTPPEDILTFFSEASRQCQSMQFWEAGVHQLKYIDSSPTTDKTISGHRIDRGGLQLEYTMRADIRNTLTARYDRYWSGHEPVDSDRAIVLSTAAASVTKYGSLQGDYAFDKIVDSAMAQTILDWMRDDLDNPRLVITLDGDCSFLPVERGDVLEFDLNESLLSQALLGQVSAGDQFMVLSKDYAMFNQRLILLKV